MGKKETNRQEQLFGLILLFAGAFILHIICAVMYKGYDTDMNCFFGWSDAVFHNGITEFYSMEGFNDYPPGYMYVLWVIGAVKNLLGLDSFTPASILLVKLPAMICDLLIGYVIYLIAKKYTKVQNAILFSALYMFNPSVIINSATWGQVDSVFTLFVLLMCYFVTEKKLTASYFVFAIGILVKPQALIFTPVLIYAIVDQVFLNDFDVKKMFKELGLGLLAIAMLFGLAAPFGLSDVLAQYVDTMGSYEYASVNAYNMWTLFGQNWQSQDTMFLFMSYKQWGMFFIVAIVAVSALFCIRNKESESKYYLTGAFIVTAMFILSVRMHERYMYPALALLLAGAVVKRNKKFFIAYGVLSFVHFLNVFHVLFYYTPEEYYNNDHSIIYITAFLSVAAFVYFCVVIFKYGAMPRELTYIEREELKAKSAAKNNRKKTNNKNARGKNTNNNRKVPVIEEKKGFDIIPSFISSKWIMADFIAIGVITVIYACVAFWRLGDMDAPQTQWFGKQGEELVFDFGETKYIDKTFCYLGYHENRLFDLYTSEDGTNWNQVVAIKEDGGSELEMVSVFCWNEYELGKDTRYLKYVLKSDDASLMEFMFFDSNGNAITPVNSSEYPMLFDEQDIFDGTYSFMNSTYFDEIYHARTAYEMVNGLRCYETTHPPLGKAIMAIGVLIFGMCPFGWRFMGTLFGVLMLPVMYLIARKITDKTWLSTVITVLFALDFMHFTQTRIATIDVFVTLFIMLEYYFMLCYYRMSFYDTPLKKTFIPLLLSGICMGLGFGAKWTGVYAGVGLAVVFFAVIFRRYMEYRRAVCQPKGKTGNIEHRHIIDNFSIFTTKTLCFCLVAFIVVPVILYVLSYIPFNDNDVRSMNNGLIKRVFDSQTYMFDYHASLDSEHVYSSTWYEWPTIVRPMLYYVESVGDGVSEGISAMGNPLIWWIGIPVFAYLVYLVFAKRDRIALFLTVGYMSQYLPWVFVTRCTFIYHYFPSVPFVVLMIGYSMYKLIKTYPKLKPAVFVYLALAAVMFVAYFPVLSAYPASVKYGEILKMLGKLVGNKWVLLF
ncbi:MAG: phospholipid carrier-dependent glycosyltransferase [Lachnospiraceae bacterium]|nr:phospholipid carrier-dependent glycosyltransferase [Lachnospiraceae bacterium]